ncbi:alpha/beta hydrolase [Variovorax dokdonensis]|uniref:Alpha/beta hydrolase n=1 Tax=Variovorax dokdonensis TaxID=344883 RepID=A0ABT7N7Q0_9BURK|nr:alpha/beta hydrolase [Variovorax dokdonensis]MDM0043910.1 alpha/beta hydrolase [Variovorax dokdonensis]
MTQDLRTEWVPGAPQIALDIAGEGPLILFLHGIGGNRTNWHVQLGHFAALGFQAAAWDLRGYGASEDYVGPLRFEDIRGDLLRVLRYLGADACHLVGLSLGGRIGFDFLQHHRDRLLSFTACSAVADAGDMPAEDRKVFLERRRAPLLAGLTPAQIAPAVAGSLAGPSCSADVLQQLIDSIAALRTDSYLKTLTATSTYQNHVDLAAIRCPVHVVAAEADPLFPLSKLRAISQAIPGAMLSVLPGLGHLSNLESPAMFNAAVEGFLRNVRAGDRVREGRCNHAAFSTSSGGVLLMSFEVRPGSEEAFNRWYDQTHVPEMLMQRGVRSARRFVTPGERVQYLTIYDLDSPEVLDSPAFVAWRDSSESTKAMVREHLVSSTRVVYKAL